MARVGPLTKAAKRLRESVQFRDVTFKCLDGNVSANKAYIAACSDYFNAMFFANPMAEASSGVVDLSSSGVPKAGIKAAECCYKMQMTNLPGRTVVILSLTATVLDHLLEYLHSSSFPDASTSTEGLDVLNLLKLRSLVQQYQVEEALPLVDIMFTDFHGNRPRSMSFLDLISEMGRIVGPDTYSSILWRWPVAWLVLEQFEAAAESIAETSAFSGAGERAAISQSAGTTKGEIEVSAAFSFPGEMSLAGVQLFLQFRSCRPCTEDAVLAALLKWLREWKAKQVDSGSDAGASEPAAQAAQQQADEEDQGNSSSRSNDKRISELAAQLLQHVQWHKLGPAALAVLGKFGDVLDADTYTGGYTGSVLL